MIYISNAMRCGMVLLIAFLLAGCVRRSMHIDSNPPGALVYLNDREVGRTPLQHDFVWYGTYDVQVRREGYETLSTRQPVIAPWWQWPPFDLLAELFPLKDERRYTYKLNERGDPAIDFEAILQRADSLRDRMERSHAAPTTSPSN
jgi:hypothetical protein